MRASLSFCCIPSFSSIVNSGFSSFFSNSRSSFRNCFIALSWACSGENVIIICFFGLKVSDYIKKDFSQISKTLNSSVKTDNEGHIWIRLKLKSTECEFSNCNYQSMSNPNTYFPSSIQFYNKCKYHEPKAIKQYLLFF